MTLLIEMNSDKGCWIGYLCSDWGIHAEFTSSRVEIIRMCAGRVSPVFETLFI